MTNSDNRTIWSVAGDSVIGRMHVRNKLPNQDSIWFSKNSDGNFPVIVTLADGHGSSKCFRSSVGSEFATRVAFDVLAEFALATDKDNIESDWLQSADRLLNHEVPITISRRWNERVANHRKEHPYTKEEFENLSESDRNQAELHPTLAYGSTLLGALITNRYAAYIQIGDGAILTVNDNGEVGKPLPGDDRLYGNETTSLAGGVRVSDHPKSPVSQKQAYADFRVRLIPISRDLPRMILLTTDGYPNSFKSEVDFIQVGPDIVSMIATNGFIAVSNELHNWLNEASENGSGDDVTLGIIYRSDPETEVERHELGRCINSNATQPIVGS